MKNKLIIPIIIKKMNYRALTILNILLNSRPEFESEEDALKWLKNIEEFCNISGVFVRFKTELVEPNKISDKIIDIDFNKIFDV